MQPIYTEDFPALVKTLAPLIGNRQIIKVDGHSGAGKSTLSRLLAHQLGLPHIELDDVVRFDGRTNYRHPGASFAANAALDRAGGRAVVDGIMLNSLLEFSNSCSEYRIFLTKNYGPRIGEAEAALRKKLGTDEYVVAYTPERYADLVVINTWWVR